MDKGAVKLWQKIINKLITKTKFSINEYLHSKILNDRAKAQKHYKKKSSNLKTLRKNPAIKTSNNDYDNLTSAPCRNVSKGRLQLQFVCKCGLLTYCII